MLIFMRTISYIHNVVGKEMAFVACLRVSNIMNLYFLIWSCSDENISKSFGKTDIWNLRRMSKHFFRVFTFLNVPNSVRCIKRDCYNHITVERIPIKWSYYARLGILYVNIAFTYRFFKGIIDFSYENFHMFNNSPELASKLSF